MVLLTIKPLLLPSFLFSTPTSTPIHTLTNDVTVLSNKLVILAELVRQMEQLVKYGPMLPEEQRGVREEEEEEKDPLGIRVGVGLSSEYKEIVKKSMQEAESLLNNTSNSVITLEKINQIYDTIKGSIMICYPMGLPHYDIIRSILEEREDFKGHAISKDILDPATSILWFCNKHMLRSENLSKYSGNNEKTKLTCKLTKKGAAAPSKEPTIDPEVQKNMMAMYQKRQAELKRIEDQDDSSNLEWANPNSLKSAFSGVGNISWKSAGLN